METEFSFPLEQWYPVELSKNVEAATATQSFLLDRDLALWRDSKGQVMAWENRCPHRSVRLTLGRVVNDQLVCGYHGWRYGSNGACTFIPAQPSLAPPKGACVKTFRAEEVDGVIWVSLSEQSPAPSTDVPQGTFCRSYVRAEPWPDVATRLKAAHFTRVSPTTYRCAATESGRGKTLLVTPGKVDHFVLHLWIDGALTLDDLVKENLAMKSALAGNLL